MYGANKEGEILWANKEEQAMYLEDLSLEDATKELGRLKKIKGQIDNGSTYGYKYLSPDGISSETLKASVNARINMIQSMKFIKAESLNLFELYDENGNEIITDNNEFIVEEDGTKVPNPNYGATNRDAYNEIMHFVVSGFSLETVSDKMTSEIANTRTLYSNEKSRYNHWGTIWSEYQLMNGANAGLTWEDLGEDIAGNMELDDNQKNDILALAGEISEEKLSQIHELIKEQVINTANYKGSIAKLERELGEKNEKSK